MSHYVVYVCDQCGTEVDGAEAADWLTLDVTLRLGPMHADFCSTGCKADFEEMQLPRFMGKVFGRTDEGGA